MCLTSAVVECWSLTQEVAGLSPFTVMRNVFCRIQRIISVADPGFSPGGCVNSQIGIIFQIFAKKLHENERIWTRGGTRPWPPLPLGSANAFRKNSIELNYSSENNQESKVFDLMTSCVNSQRLTTQPPSHM